MSRPFLLDTNAISHAVANPKGKVAARMMLHQQQLHTPAIVIAEINYDLAKQSTQALRQDTLDVLAQTTILDFDPPAALAYGKIRNQLERAGTPIGAMDMLIAAQAISADLTLITNNTTEFQKVSNLQILDWQE